MHLQLGHILLPLDVRLFPAPPEGPVFGAMAEDVQGAEYKVGIRILFSQPDQTSFCVGTNVPHQANLVIAFGFVLLVDAQLVDPQISRGGASLEVGKELCNRLGHGYCPVYRD